MNPHLIEIGDLVEVETVHLRFLGKVLYIPQSTGDAWVVNAIGAILYYIQTYEYIRLVKKGEQDAKSE